MKEELLDKLQNINSTIKAFEPVVKRYLANKDYPLAERWEVFAEIPKGMCEAPWHQKYSYDGEKIHWNEDYYVERYSLVDNLDVIENYEENNWNPETEKIENVGAINDLKEQMLQSGVRYWTYDW